MNFDFFFKFHTLSKRYHLSIECLFFGCRPTFYLPSHTKRCRQISALPRTVYSRFIKKHKLFQIISYRIKVINIEFIGNIYFFPLIVTKTSFELSKNFKMCKFKRNVRRIYTFFDVCYIGNAGYVLNIFLQSPHLHIRHESSNEAFLLLKHTNWLLLSLSVLINIWF